MAYVAPSSKFTMLSNALSGVTKGMNDFAVMKLETNKMAQQQEQFEANLKFGFDKLDEQIRQFDVGTQERRDLEAARNDLVKQRLKSEERRHGETIESADKRASMQANVQYSRLRSEERRHGETIESADRRASMQADVQYSRQQKEQEWRDAQLEAQNSKSLSVLDYVNTFEPVEEPKPEAFEGGVEDFRYQSSLAVYQGKLNQQTTRLAENLSGLDKEVTPELMARAGEILQNRVEFRDRVIDSIQRQSTAKAQGLASRTGRRVRPPGARPVGASAESGFGNWKVKTDSAPVWIGTTTDSAGEPVSVTRSGVPLQPGESEGMTMAVEQQFMRRPDQADFYDKIARQVYQVDDQDLSAAQTAYNEYTAAMETMGDHYNKYGKAMASKETIVSSGRSLNSAAINLEKVLQPYGITNQVSEFTNMQSDFWSYNQDLPKGLNWQEGSFGGEEYTPTRTTSDYVSEATEAAKAQMLDSDPDAEVEGALEMFGDAFDLSKEQMLYMYGGSDPSKIVPSSEMQMIHARIAAMEEAKGRKLTSEERSSLLMQQFGG